MINLGTPPSGKSNDTDSLMALVKREAAKSDVGIRHLEGPAELAQRVLLKRGVGYSYHDSLETLVTKLTAGE